VQRERLLAEMLPPIPVRQSSPAIEPAVTMVSVKVEDWDGGPAAKVTVPMMDDAPAPAHRGTRALAGAADRCRHPPDQVGAQVGQAADEAVQQAAAPDDATGPSCQKSHAGGASAAFGLRHAKKSGYHGYQLPPLSPVFARG